MPSASTFGLGLGRLRDQLLLCRVFDDGRRYERIINKHHATWLEVRREDIDRIVVVDVDHVVLEDNLSHGFVAFI